MNTFQKIQRFFKDNPDEELSEADMALKFGCSDRYLEGILPAMVSDGRLIQRWEGSSANGGFLVYSKGSPVSRTAATDHGMRIPRL